ncbi:MAG: ABC-2 transporter permease [Clostridia bacterium]|nr:ABC-2 transporter permease [Clostridia bacterium]
MKNLLYKEYRLCFHSTLFFFLPFVVMLLIPNYPYLVAFFFVCNGIFNSFSQAALDQDLLFTSLLPVSKADAVRGKYLFVASVQAMDFLLFIPMVFLNHAVHPEGNAAGADACLTMLGGGLIVFAIFNYVFIPRFYKKTDKFGQSFLTAVIAMFVWIFLAEGMMIAAKAAAKSVPAFAWIASNLGTFPSSGEAWIAQAVFFAVCVLAYVLLTVLSCRRSIRIFSQISP